ncbi:hypothetical protein NKH77_34370 [Streptomyces sp. M19]
MEFRDRVIQELWENEHRALAPSFGIDVVPVLQHCLHARRHDVTYGGWLIGILLVGLLRCSPRCRSSSSSACSSAVPARRAGTA